MRKIVSVIVLCLMALTMNAQKCAVLEFRGSASVSLADIDGISEMFMTYFRPSGYTMVERAQIDKVISEQHFQRSNITENQAVQLGKILNASMVIVGKISLLGGQYQVDVRAVDVQSGHDVAFEGATFSGDYRTNVRNLATKLSKQLEQLRIANLGWIDLGLPSGTLWKDKDEEGGFYTYDQAKTRYGNSLPTKEQIEELLYKCKSYWTGNGYKFVGQNGASIVLPATGYRECDGNVRSVGEYGSFWLSTPFDSEQVMTLSFVSLGVTTIQTKRCSGQSVRLVKNP